MHIHKQLLIPFYFIAITNTNAAKQEITFSNIHVDNDNLEIAPLMPPPPTLEEMLQRLKKANGNSIKINNKGHILDKNAKTWDCLHEKNSGLTWEIKTTEGLRDQTNTYTWIPPNTKETTAFTWFENKYGKCTGSALCETTDYIATINQQRLCNFSDWRLPNKAELESLISMSGDKNETKINNKLFPNTLASWYWTADSNVDSPDYAWYVLFKNGISLSDKKENPKHIRLVRGNL